MTAILTASLSFSSLTGVGISVRKAPYTCTSKDGSNYSFRLPMTEGLLEADGRALPGEAQRRFSRDSARHV